LKKWGVKKIKYLGLIAAPKASETFHSPPRRRDLPRRHRYHLNQRGYIIPGMGDAGDRQFSGE